MQQQIFSSNLFFLPVKQLCVYPPARIARGGSHCEVCTLMSLLGLLTAQRIEGFGYLYTELPQDLFHL